MAMKKFQMLNLICENCTLTSKEKLVAQYFVYKSNRSGECYPSVQTISKHCGVSERTVQRATKKLQERDYIIIEKRYYKGRQSSNQYKLNTEICIEDEIEVTQEVIDNEVIHSECEVVSLADILNIDNTINNPFEDDKVVDNQCLQAVEVNETTIDNESDNIIIVENIKLDIFNKKILQHKRIRSELKLITKCFVIFTVYYTSINFFMIFRYNYDEFDIFSVILKEYNNKVLGATREIFCTQYFYAIFRGDMVTPELYYKN